VDGSGGGTLHIKTQAPPTVFKAYINERKGTIERVPAGVDPAFNWHQGKVSRRALVEQTLQEAEKRYERRIQEQATDGIAPLKIDQALSAGLRPPSLYETPILITRNQKYTRLSLDEAIHRELGYLQDETRKTGTEYMSLMEQGGKLLLGTWSSGKTNTKIFLSDEIRHILKAQGNGTLYLLHSHPDNTFFSANDLAIMCRYESIAQMQVILLNRRVHAVLVGEGERLKTGEELAELFKFMNSLKGFTNEENLHHIKKRYRWR
jgi:hypothetical protein